MFSFYSPCIITMYQYSNVKKNDYIVMEKLDCTFWNYVQSSPKEKKIKGIILQILFTLLVLQNKAHGFRHNYLKIDNILLDFTPRKQDITLRFKKYFWYLPKDIPIAKIADFDYSCIPNKIINTKINTEHSKSFGCTETPIKIYDTHLFLN